MNNIAARQGNKIYAYQEATGIRIGYWYCRIAPLKDVNDGFWEWRLLPVQNHKT